MKTKLRFDLNNIFIPLVCIISLFLACTKTELVDYQKEEKNRILEYKIKTATGELLGAIDNDNNTITVYIPYFISLSVLDATIKLDEGASLLDVEGELINLDGGLEPIPLGQNTKYIVESSTGARRSYTVIQKIAAHSSPLTVSYIGAVEGVTLEKPVHSLLRLTGNFESTNTQAKFYFKDKLTGKTHDDFVSINNIVSGSPNYVMTINILPTALAGEYEVSMEHLGRKTNLPDIKLKYTPGIPGFFLSTTKYAPGEEMILKAEGYGLLNGAVYDNNNGVFIGLKRVYLKMDKAYVYLTPEGFSEDLYNKEIPLEIISWNRSEVRVKFPNLPQGKYGTFYAFGKYFPFITDIGMGFYFDFDEQTNWGNGVLLSGISSTLEVL
ncbi:hypothetical protein [Sphingobacterium pedocola]|uniref:DUF5018 domain-containing protein n=1 Tax=Sphingobacterium pedocola TaxID=2082722 RepID=A0ABR9T3N6_9SPHI|nr:hypothetical protein [Sphingobacterium pedocola]MBE8719968.1 hypothetical protein [Sphingobacterium pedocola]